MTVSAADVKTLRQETGAGMMDCKKALQQANGDLDQARKYLREQGVAKAAKRSSRDASEGSVHYLISEDKHTGVLVEVNCETDFVARSTPFKTFVAAVAKAALANKDNDVKSLEERALDQGGSVESARHAAVQSMGENIQIKRVQFIDAGQASLAGYQHGDGLSVLVALSEDNAEVGKNIAMHVAALNPAAVQEQDIPAELIDQERSIYETQLKDSNKPEEIRNKIIAGKLKKYAGTLCLYGQPYVKDPKQTVAEYLQQEKVDVTQFQRFALGEILTTA